MAKTFSFDNAAFHFARTEGPSGFLWKYLLTFGVCALLLAVLQFILFRPLVSAYAMMFQAGMSGASEDEINEIMMAAMLENIGAMMIGYVIVLILGIVFWACFEAASQRRYIREQGFSLRLGADEWRLIVVMLIWIAIFIAGYIATILGTMLLVLPVGLVLEGRPELIAVWAALVVFVLLFVWLFLAVRLSAASAMTIRDRAIRFFASWGATKGRFWPMLGAYAVLALILGGGITVIYMIGGGTLMAGIMSNASGFEAAQSDPEAMLELMLSPGIIGPLIGFYALILIFQGFAGYAWAGVAALAAKTDPRIGGQTGVATEFD